jgi:hypothetical protein
LFRLELATNESEVKAAFRESNFVKCCKEQRFGFPGKIEQNDCIFEFLNFSTYKAHANFLVLFGDFAGEVYLPRPNLQFKLEIPTYQVLRIPTFNG